MKYGGFPAVKGGEGVSEKKIVWRGSSKENMSQVHDFWNFWCDLSDLGTFWSDFSMQDESV